MQKLLIIRVREALEYWKGIYPQIELTEERLEHIRKHHPDDFAQCVNHIDAVIENPDLILDDHKNPFTAMFIRRFEAMGVNVIVKLALRSEPESRSFIVTVHPVGERSIQKLEKKNKVVYKRPSHMI